MRTLMAEIDVAAMANQIRVVGNAVADFLELQLARGDGQPPTFRELQLFEEFEDDITARFFERDVVSASFVKGLPVRVEGVAVQHFSGPGWEACPEAHFEGETKWAQSRTCLDRVERLSLHGSSLADVAAMSRLPRLEALTLFQNCDLRTFDDAAFAPKLKKLWVGIETDELPTLFQSERARTLAVTASSLRWSLHWAHPTVTIRLNKAVFGGEQAMAEVRNALASFSDLTLVLGSP